MARVRMCGAGGPGGYAQANSDASHVSAGGSGGAGGEIEFWFDVSDGSPQSITVGASAESTNTNIQSTSGSSWFGAAVECQGGNEGGYGVTTGNTSLSIGVQAGGGAAYVHDSTKVLSVVYQKQGQGGAGGWAINGTVYPGIGTPSGWGLAPTQPITDRVLLRQGLARAERAAALIQRQDMQEVLGLRAL